MDKAEAERAIEIVDELRLRAIEIVSNAPYWHYVYESNWAWVSMDGDTATLNTCKATTDYDCAVLDTEAVQFPAALLFVSPEELAYWKAEERRIYDAKQKAQKLAQQQQAQEQERAAYERLKAKFEPL